MLYDYTAFIIFIIAASCITFLIVGLGDISFEPQYDMEKSSPYECGFQPFNMELQQFDVKYYVVALFFLIFDVEMAFIIPFVNMSHSINVYAYLNFVFFFILLIFGLLYEWKKNYLEWE